MEIQVPLELSDEEASLLDMHSVLNVLNVLNFELLQISEHLEQSEPLIALMDDVAGAGELLRDHERARELVEGIENFITKVEQTLDAASEGAEPATLATIAPHRDNLQTIHQIIRIRAREILARLKSPDAWTEHRIEELKSNFVEFLAAVEKNSHGSYRIVQNLAAQGQEDYLIQFEISSNNSETVCMPVIFQDVMRDLLANARKYTGGGGQIQGGLHQDENGLRFILKDNGIGIPADSIEDVVLFGKRAANVADRVTRGGGFGLTKAYYVTRRYRGRMWIESSTDQTEGSHGTRIEIRIPQP